MSLRYRTLLSTLGGAAWSPVNLFTGGINGGYYNPNIISSLWQDVAGTTPITTDGQLVARIDDLSGNNKHLFQATSGLRPIFRTSGGVNFLEFDKAEMLSDLTSFGGDCFIFIKHEFNSNPGISRHLFGFSNNLNVANPTRMLAIEQMTTVERMRFRGRNTDVDANFYFITDSNSANNINTTYNFFGQCRNNRAMEFYRNNALISSIASSGTIGTMNDVRIGLGNSSFPTGFVYKFFRGIVCNKIATTDERNLINNFF